MSESNKELDNVENKDDSYATTSSQLSGTQLFKNKTGQCVSAFPLLVDFRRLIRLKATDSLLPGVINQDLLHAVVGLYDVSLSDLTPDVLYATVCEKWARTIILIRDLKELETEIKKKASVRENLAHDDSLKLTCNSSVAASSETDRVCEPADDIFKAEESLPSIFASLYSDNEEDDDDEDEDDEDEDGDFSIGIHSFIKTVCDRKKLQQTDPDTSCAHIGIEQRIVGCVTFEKKYLQSKERVVHLTLLSVRKRFQHCGVGKYLLSQVMDPSVAGFCDAVVVHADNSAADFFRRYAFSDDIVLNSRWSELAEQFTNCTLMCYLPGFSVGDRLIDTKLADTDISFADSDKDFKKWKTKSIEAYQAQVTCLTRLRHEVIHLRKLVGAQKGLINTLLAENEEIKQGKLNTEQELLLHTRRASSDIHHFLIGDEAHNVSMEMGDTGAVTECLQKQVKRLSVYKMDDHHIASYGATDFNDEPYDHAKDAAMFYRILNQFSKCINQNKSEQQLNYEVKLISKAQLLETKVNDFRLRWRRGSNDRSQCAELYYCGSLQCPERIQKILNEGFSEQDFSYGDYGRGLYFSKHPDTAAQFSTVGKLLLAEVIVHPEEKVTTKDRTRTSCSLGYQALLTPGRLFSGNGDMGSADSEEFLIFDANQVLPICALFYESGQDNLTS